MPRGDSIRVEVVWAGGAEQRVRRVELEPGATVGQALAASGLDGCAGFSKSCSLVVRGRPVDSGRVLAHGDRLEILRPLRVDPKSARHSRAARRRVQTPDK